VKVAAPLLILMSAPLSAAEKKTATASLQVTATVVAPPVPPEQVEGVTVIDTLDEDGNILMRTYVFPHDG
jgi:hypothetical protein